MSITDELSKLMDVARRMKAQYPNKSIKEIAGLLWSSASPELQEYLIRVGIGQMVTDHLDGEREHPVQLGLKLDDDTRRMTPAAAALRHADSPQSLRPGPPTSKEGISQGLC